jgi:hypothetical protein
VRRLVKPYLKTCLSAAFFLTIVLSNHYAYSEGVTIAANSKPTGAIVLWINGNNQVAKFAASELQRYFKKISGATVPLVIRTYTSSINYLNSTIVILGGDVEKYIADPNAESELINLLGSKLSVLKPDGFVIQTENDKVFLAGINERGTLYASYKLIEILGVRFFAPNYCFYQGNAEYVPQASTMIIPSLSITEEPSFKYRTKEIDQCISHTKTTLLALIDWMAKKRMNLISFLINTNHAMPVKGWEEFRDYLTPELQKRGIMVEAGEHGVYDSFLAKNIYEETHPEWFAKPDDPVTGINNTPPANVFHVTNEDALQTLINNSLKYIKSRPEIDIFAVWPPDNAKWPESDINQLGSISNASAYVLNKLKSILSKEVPNKISGISYNPQNEPPSLEYMYDTSTSIRFAFSRRSYTVPIFDPSDAQNAYYNALIGEWRNRGFTGPVRIYEYYRKYSWHSLPVILISLISQEIPYYFSQSAEDVSSYSEAADWITYEIVHLIVSELLWNKNLNVNNYLQDYVQARYGPAASNMLLYYSKVEEAGRLFFNSPSGNYSNLQVVAKVLNDYVEAKNILLEAQKVQLSNSASFLITLLTKNAEYAVADFEIYYYTRLSDVPKLNNAKLITKTLIENNRFNGIILHNYNSARRYDDTVNYYEVTPFFCDLYEKAFDSNCLKSTIDLVGITILLLD